MPTVEQTRTRLLDLLRAKSVFNGDFALSSGGRSEYYVDCKLTTLDPQGAWLVGQAMHTLIRREEAARKTIINAVGRMTMVADPIAQAVGVCSDHAKDSTCLIVLLVPSAPNAHGGTNLTECDLLVDE